MIDIQEVKSGDIVRVNDIQTLQDRIKEGKGADTLESFVTRVQEVGYNSRDSILWRFIELADNGLTILYKLLTTLDGEKIEQYSVLFEPPDFTPGTRQEIMENGFDWLFEGPPEERQTFGGIVTNWESMKWARDIDTDQSPFHINAEYYCSGTSGTQVVAEWLAINECDNPRLIALEIDGYIRLFQGVDIRDNELEIFNRS